MADRRDEIRDKLAQRRRDQGYSRDESRQMLHSLLSTHTGERLAKELTFNSFATPFTAAKLAAEWVELNSHPSEAYSAFGDGLDAAFRRGRYWHISGSEIPTCPHATGTQDEIEWELGFDHGTDLLMHGPDPEDE